MNNRQPAQAAAVRAQKEEALFSKAKVEAPWAAWLSRLSRRPRDRDRMLPLYEAVVARARDRFWYRDGQVPDTVDGRFDMLSALLAIVLLRFEAEPGDEAKHASVLLTEIFVEDMDETLHQIGIGDYVVGKHVGRMMGALGGRLTVFRAASRDRAFEPPVRRNIYHEAPPSEAVARLVAERLERFDAGLLTTPLDRLIEGKLPPL